MRFVCDSCRAQYMISDDKVGPKGVKVRCKKCGYVILVRRPELTAAAGESEHAPPAPEPAPQQQAQDDEEPTSPGYQAKNLGRSILEGVADDEIGAVFDQVLSSAGAASREGESQPGLPLQPFDDRTREVDASLVQKLLEQSGPVQPAAAPEGQQNGSAHDWFVAIDEKQVGPLTFDKVKDLWDRGEIGPDSLCWRAGLADWVTLSDTELASLLAPKPVKPVIVAPAPVVAGSAPVGGPVESVFSAGPSTKPPRAEVAPAADAEEAGSWKPSAASALASLMKQEIDVLAKQPATAAAPDPSTGSARLLDVPTAQSNGRLPSSPSLRASAAEPNAARGFANTLASQPTYPPTYPPFAPKSSKRTIVLLSVCAGALLLALAVVTTVLVTKPSDSADEVPKAKPKSAAAKSGPARNQTEPGAKGEGAASAKPEGTAAAKGEASPSKADAAPSGGKPDTAAKAEVGPPSPTAKAEVPPPTARTERSSGTRRERLRSGSHAGEEITVPKKAEKSEVVARARPTAEDEFDKEFGSEHKGAAKADPAPPKKPSAVYVPPAPGSEIPESLGQSDIMQVVVANKPAILRCVTEQKKKDANLSGRLVMRWTILTSGKTTNISCQSDEFKSSYMAQCMSGLIKGWQFPRHKTQGEPINFPFTF